MNDGDETRMPTEFVDRFARMETKLDMLVNQFTTQNQDHENRIRNIERWKYALPTSVFGMIVSIIVAIWQISK